MPAGENSIGGLIVSVPNGRAEFQAPPLKLRRVATIRVVVVDGKRTQLESAEAGHARIDSTTSPATSVSRKSRP
jgi:hypothetical protein